MRVRIIQLRPLVIITLLCFAAANSACAQEKSKRMVPGASVKELVPESPNEKEDGISKIIIGQLFKPGNTEYTRIGPAGLKDAPPLPTGYILFKDLAFKIQTEAITSGYQLTVFSLPSVENEAEFNRLTILHLEDDEMSPAGKSWQPVIVVPEGWDDHYHFVLKGQYESLEPDFKSRRVAAITQDFGVFLMASAPEFSLQSTQPFTQVEVVPTSSPESVRVGEDVTHTIVVKNKGPRSAAEVNFKEEIDPDLDYISATPDRGTCKGSDQSKGRVLCYLGAMPPGVNATIRISLRVKQNVLWSESDGFRKSLNIVELVLKERSTDFVVMENQIFTEFSTIIIRNH